MAVRRARSLSAGVRRARDDVVRASTGGSQRALDDHRARRLEHEAQRHALGRPRRQRPGEAAAARSARAGRTGTPSSVRTSARPLVDRASHALSPRRRAGDQRQTHRASCLTSTGSSITKRAPPAGLSSTQTRPPCSRTCSATSDSPRPVPDARARSYPSVAPSEASEDRRRSSSGTPGPSIVEHELHATAGGLGDRHGSRPAGVALRVLDDVAHRLGEPTAVADDVSRGIRRRT